MNTNNTVSFVIPPQFDVAGYFSQGLASVKIGDKYGYIDNTGQVAIKPQFDDVEEFSEGLVSYSLQISKFRVSKAFITKNSASVGFTSC